MTYQRFNFIVLYSGGIGSFLAAYLIKNAYPEAQIVLYFNDTKTEDKDLYRFLKQTVKWLDLPLVNDSDGRDVWQTFQDEKYVGNTRSDICSRILKRDRSHKYIIDHFNPNKTKIVIGIDWTESHRWFKARKHWEPFDLIAPLIETNTHKDLLWNELYQIHNIKKPKLYDLGFSHNNCGGFCVKAGLAQFKLLLEKLPDVYMYHEQKEQETYDLIGSVYPFLRKTINGKLEYITMKQYRIFLESGKNLTYEESIDYGGCGCAL
jgi:Phosphoadenosine phosphosulfate reductase family